jgi:outer membrane immunogenic protein
MIRFLLAATLLAFGFTGAMAADLPLKAPPIIAAEYNWSGIYGGINVGWIDDHYRWNYTNPSPATCCAPFTADKDNWLLGGHFGAQYQFNHIVLGAEAAVMTSGDPKTSTVGCVAPNSLTVACTIRRDTIFTAGGRLGYAWDRWMIFGSGGWASSNVNSNLVNPPPGNVAFDPTSVRHDNGWYAGVGFEYMLLKGPLVDVIVGAEYQHIDLGTKLYLSSLDGFFPCPPGVNCRNIGATEDLVRARLSLKWNPWVVPVVAKY